MNQKLAFAHVVLHPQECRSSRARKRPLIGLLTALTIWQTFCRIVNRNLRHSAIAVTGTARKQPRVCRFRPADLLAGGWVRTLLLLTKRNAICGLAGAPCWRRGGLAAAFLYSFRQSVRKMATPTALACGGVSLVFACHCGTQNGKNSARIRSGSRSRTAVVLLVFAVHCGRRQRLPSTPGESNLLTIKS